MKTALINLRNLHYRLTHSEWLEKAGFSSGGNCYIRNDGRMAAGNYRVHMTMFPTDGQIEVGAADGLDALKNKVYRVNTAGHISMHATLYVSDTNKLEQIKVYVSGVDWSPPRSHIDKWAADGIVYATVKANLTTWMNNNKTAANDGLKAVFDKIHVNDNATIA
jgi:hypothetical protein